MTSRTSPTIEQTGGSPLSALRRFTELVLCRVQRQLRKKEDPCGTVWRPLRLRGDLQSRIGSSSAIRLGFSGRAACGIQPARGTALHQLST